jgi:hypothetical protein
MRTLFRIERRLIDEIRADLTRPHAFAYERVGFIACRVGEIENGFTLLAERYLPVADEDYEDDPRVGAMMGSAAIRKALQVAYRDQVSMVHVHQHEHRGVPRFSSIDLYESAKFVPDFFKVCKDVPHGTLVLSQDAMVGMAWNPSTRARCAMTELSVIGRPLSIWRTRDVAAIVSTKFSR